MRVGILFDLYDDYPWLDDEPVDAAAENEPLETVETIEDALRIAGHEPVRVGGARDLMARIHDPGFDVAVNIAEGARSRNREGQVPMLLELLDIPFAGSDASSLSLSLDKAWTKDLVRAAGVRTPAYTVAGAESAPGGVDVPAPFPLFVKPRYEGSAKGLTARSRVEDEESLAREVRRVIDIYRQDALVEAFVDGGGEFTVAVAGDPPEALPVIQRAVERETRIGLHVLERDDLPGRETSADPTAGLEWDLPGDLTAELERRLQTDALTVFRKLECRDFARVDFRVDAEGNPWFLEINPLPTFRPGDTFAISAELVGRTYPEFLADLLGGAVERALERDSGGRVRHMRASAGGAS